MALPIENGWIKIGALIAALAVVIGGFDFVAIVGRYVLTIDEGIVAGQAADVRTAVTFQLVHALAIIAVGILLVLRPGRLLHVAAWFFLAGILVFCGSVYLEIVIDATWLGMLKPVGVVLLVIGWFLVVEGACPGWNKQAE